MLTSKTHKVSFTNEQVLFCEMLTCTCKFYTQHLLANTKHIYNTTTKDWAYQRLQEQNGAAKKDYANANMDPKQIALSTVWAGIVFWFGYYLITGLAEGKWTKADGTDLLHGNLWTLPF